jgi:hypothetical protein
MFKAVWNVEKNNQLKADVERRICFEDVVAAIDSGGLLDDISHPNTEKYPGQRIFVGLCNDYVSGVPYVLQEDGRFFLKTAFPSRVLKKRYLPGEDDGKHT